MQKPIFDEYGNYDFPTDVKLDEPNTMCWSVVNPISLLAFDIMGEIVGPETLNPSHWSMAAT